MQTLAAHGAPPRRPWLIPTVVVAVAAVVAAGLTYWLAGGGTSSVTPPPASPTRGSGPTTTAPDPFTLGSTTPATGATAVASNTSVTVRFTQPLAAGTPDPALDPAVAGHWRQSGTSTLVFHPTAPFIPGTDEVLTVPGGSRGIAGQAGMHLDASTTVRFTIATGSTLRLQQLLADLGYLPLAYTTPTPAPAPQDMAQTQPGTLSWRWSDLPATLTSLWTQGNWSNITKGAVMNFENQNGLTVDGLAGPMVWGTLLAAVAAHKGDTQPYTYVTVVKTLPEHLTVYEDGTKPFSGIPVNTGAPGADTADGTFEVFEHVKASEMKGTNVTGSTYDDKTVPWASYFNGGDALHGFPRAQLRLPPVQRVRGDADHNSRQGVAADPHRHPGDGLGAVELDRAAAPKRPSGWPGPAAGRSTGPARSWAGRRWRSSPGRRVRPGRRRGSPGRPRTGWPGSGRRWG